MAQECKLLFEILLQTSIHIKVRKLSHHYHIDWNSHTRTYLKRRYEGTEFSMHLDWENWTYKAVKVRNKTICVVT